MRNTWLFLLTAALALTSCLPQGEQGRSSASPEATTTRGPESEPLKDAYLDAQWNRVNESIKTTLATKITDPQVLYNVQIDSSSFLQYAVEENKSEWIYSIMDAYLGAANSLTYANSYTYYYPMLSSGIPYSASLPLSATHPMWLGADGIECVLCSAQFLYSVTLLLQWNVRSGAYLKSAVAKQFLNTYLPVAVAHYRRWVLAADSPVGTFQVRGWACNNGNFSHDQHVENLRHRRYGTSYFPSFPGKIHRNYCNAVTDIDLFLFAGVMHLLMAERTRPGILKITNMESTRFYNYSLDGLDLFRSRLNTQSLVDRQGRQQTGLVLDPGSFDDHPDLSYAGDTGATFPGWTSPSSTPVRSATPAQGVGWDVSHARRLTLFLFSLEQAAEPLGLVSSAERKGWELGFANQLAYKVFLGNYANPKFTNYFDGTNGWYRVNYSNRSGSGYAPSNGSMARAVLEGGYVFWGRSNPDLYEIVLATESKITYPLDISCLNIYASLPKSFFALKSPPPTERSVCQP